MAITKKPGAPTTSTPKVDVDELIAKGGSVPKDAEGKRYFFVQLRLEKDLIARIDRARNSRTVKVPRHTWLLEAIHEKLGQVDP